ncbi:MULTISPECIES: iron ABC transporter permease [unclassified Exiguobacterium]|uniref:FecCD family ABC transporter permease n=1 Tax=unclassified Exiguobacterium TaxID=2644629 RepID=UPI001039B060|nr:MULTISPECIES: iron ABC transporter permease [unclassified Exiguobacterium]TCI43101.1 iron ABC transporter permease [Exiguobacterium sp. SH5S32]TCI49886.1 iron ABC transporter permease [Exiguobacterium sp. SH1S4]TCI68122.1 iron ABC transporter permease [Exiguobacterium sp. SH1S1]TCI75920.1 iron ABC transporter permease [Exiguobacterium sp. SH0S1]
MKSYSFRKGPFSFTLRRREIVLAVALLVGLIIAIYLGLAIGETFLTPWSLGALFVGSGDAFAELIVFEFRMPRVLMAITAGACLAVSGHLLQLTIKNELASPEIFGIVGGAGVATATFFTVFTDERTNQLSVPLAYIPFASFAGALAVGAFLFYLLKRGVPPVRLALIGIGISIFSQGIVQFMMLASNVYRKNDIQQWLTGTVYAATWKQLTIMVPLAILFLLAAFLIERHVRPLHISEAVATSIGVPVRGIQRGTLLLSCLLAGVGVAFVGAIGFVGLMAPHIARQGLKLPYVWATLLVGATIVVLADAIGRTIFYPYELRTGVMTAVIGAPYFFYLLRRMMKGSMR